MMAPVHVVLAGAAGAGGTSLCGRPALDWLLDTVEELAPAALSVAGDGAPATELLASRPALRHALTAREACPTTMVLPCSLPLLRAHTLSRILGLVDRHADRSAAVAQVVPETPWWTDPSVVDVGSAVVALHGIPELPADLGTLPGGLSARGIPVCGTRVGGVEALSPDTPADRGPAATALYALIADGWMSRGVLIDDPATTRIDATVELHDGVRIGPYTELVGETVVGRGSHIGPATTLLECQVGEQTQIQYSFCKYSRIGNGANIGPYTWLRSGTVLGDNCRAGAFVEVADSVVGEGTEIPHLAGLFSADVGRGCNISSMAGSLNFNGGKKRRTRIGDEVFIGSGSILIAPVSIGDRAETAAGSVIHEDVPAGALGISRPPQRNVSGWAEVRRRQA
jgi:serine acetyltransferase